MVRFFILFFALLLPLQFVWSAASAYCGHEPAERQASHVGHHVHTHEGEAKKTAATKLAVDPDCASCHAAATPIITSRTESPAFAPAAAFAAQRVLPPVTSAPSRAPDRPQWLRLV